MKVPKPKRETPKAKLRRLLKAQRRSLQRRARPTSRKVSKRFAKKRDTSYVRWIASLPCIALGVACNGPVQVCHFQSRGAGGADYGNTFPACARHHTLQHAAGIKTWAAYWMGSFETLRRLTHETLPRNYERAVEWGWAPEKP